MRNADLPASPVDYNSVDQLEDLCVTESTGLTKREYYEGLAMAAIVSRMSCHPRDVAYEAVGYADALLNAQEKPNE